MDMKTKLMTLAAVVVVPVLASLLAFADDNRAASRNRPGVEPVTNADYRNECGACHFAYQPGLLPARSWQALMTGLDQHFGENAELDAELNNQIGSYLVANAADDAKGWLSRRIMKSLPATAVPLRISEVPVIAGEHREIPARLYRDNPDVGSLANCSACHRKADTGLYDEDLVSIPGHGKWDD
jgi:cytochrome c553